MVVERRARRWSAAKQPHPHHLLQQQQHTHACNVATGACANATTAGPSPLASHSGRARTGRLTLPGIGTVLEVPLLVAKRLHPNLGVRSHPHLQPHHHPHHQHHRLVHQQTRGDVSDSDDDDDDDDFDNQEPRCTPSCSIGGTDGNMSGGCNFSRSGNCGAAGSSASPTTTTRIYHHQGNKKGSSNIVASNFPAIDEDSV